MALTKTLDVVGIGNAIVDVLVHAADDQLDNLELTKGTMALVDEQQAERLYASVGPGLETSGGSAANTLAGIAQLAAGPASSGVCETISLAAFLPTTFALLAPVSTRRPPRKGLPQLAASSS